MHVPDLLTNAVRRFPGRPCVVEGDRTLTFADVDRRASALVAAFRERGLRRGDRVALLALNEIEYLEIQVAAMRAGVTLVPLNYRLAVPELAYIVDDCEPRLLIHGPGYADHAARLDVEGVVHLGSKGHGDSYEEMLDAANPAASIGQVDADDASAILYTSGTTGRPKGAIIPNSALWARVNMFGLEVANEPGDVFVQALPMFHIAAHLAYAFTYRGGTLVMVREFDPADVIRTLESAAATHVLLVPTMINLVTEQPSLADADLSSLRMVLYGASPIPPEVLRRAIDALGCDFLQFYGMTETAGCSLLRPADHDPDRFPERLASAGTDSLSMETRVVDENDETVPTGHVGEIITRGPCVMDGYWNDPDATKQALRGGWMHTGDLGHRSEDGYLFLTDRLKDMIVSGGENVYPREVEDVLYEHADVHEAAVIGVPDERWGERVHAVVVAREGVAVEPSTLIEHCRENLAGYKLPKTVEFVDELPRNATGKILKRELRERY